MGQEGSPTQAGSELNALRERVKTLSSEKAALQEKLKKLSKAKKRLVFSIHNAVD